MPQYYFDLLNGDGFVADEVGLEFATLQAAQAEAARALAEMALDEVSHSPPRTGHRMAIEVRDDTGPVMQIRFTFEIEPKTR
jgi:hypothetical protein